jgi:hypothetical protein
MFIVTAQLVKPVNRDDLPQMRGIDGLKNGSPLGVEPKGAEIQGQTGFSITGQQTETAPAAAPKTAEPEKVADPKAKSTETGTDSTGSASSGRRINKDLPMAKAIPANFTYELVSP